MMTKSDSIKELAAALVKVQAEIRDAHKDKQAYGYRYAELGQLLELARPLLAANGLALSQHPVSDGAGGIAVESLLMHVSGEWLESSLPIPASPGKNTSAAQAAGSAITYARRYALAAVVGITQTDDDGASVGSDSAPIASKPIATITDNQASELSALLEQTGTDAEKFCAFFKISGIGDMPADAYDRAVQMLKKKIASAA